MGEIEIHSRKELIEELKAVFDDPELTDNDIAGYANDLLIWPDKIVSLGDGLFKSFTNYN